MTLTETTNNLLKGCRKRIGGFNPLYCGEDGMCISCKSKIQQRLIDFEEILEIIKVNHGGIIAEKELKSNIELMKEKLK